jgi:hypothetical protein
VGQQTRVGKHNAKPVVAMSELDPQADIGTRHSIDDVAVIA